MLPFLIAMKFLVCYYCANTYDRSWRG